MTFHYIYYVVILTSICLLQNPVSPWWAPVGNNPVKMIRVQRGSNTLCDVKDRLTASRKWPFVNGCITDKRRTNECGQKAFSAAVYVY